MLQLRPYQSEALLRVREAYTAGKRRVLVSLPTGTGKTVVFAHLPSALKMKKRLLVLAHREELLVQAQDKFRAVDPELTVDIEQAGAHASDDARVVVASVPTLARGSSTRLSRLVPDDFSIVVVDEAHHAVAPTYRRILDHFGLFEPGTSRFLIGFTATPRRGDHQGLGDVFEEVCYARDLREMIRGGYLVPIAGWRVDTGVSLDGVTIRHGDFVENQLARVVNTTPRNHVVVQAYRELAPGRRAIVFCVNVAHAQDVQRAFAESDIHAGAVWGALPKDERRATLARFSGGELDVVTNCNVLTEGFDEPRVDCVIMARPTRSKLLYAQMVGRGTRVHPGKSELLVVDVADNSRAHQLPGLHTLFNLPATMNLRGGDAFEVEREIERLTRMRPWVDTARIRSPDDLKLAAERIEFFNFDPPAELVGHTGNTWYSVPGGYRLALPKGERISIVSNLLDGWDVEHGGPGMERTLIHRARTLPFAVEAADGFVAIRIPDASQLVRRHAPWRRQPPTDRQREVLGRYGIRMPEGLTRGQASQMISAVMASERDRGGR
ncbi:MAG: DEAD/DEAH box helicase [Gemmatimonadaceae bacterium]